MVGVTYILDEPSIGLHQRDNKKLLKTLEKLRDLGNSCMVVEHDEETMFFADHVIDIVQERVFMEEKFMQKVLQKKYPNLKIL